MRDKAFNVENNPKYDNYQCGIVSVVYESFDKETSGSGIKNKNMLDQHLTEELKKQIIRKFKKRNVHSPFIDNI